MKLFSGGTIKMASLKKKRASAAIEYMAMITFILAAFFIFQHYIVRGFSGRWKAVGDTFGHGKQYDPKEFGPGGKGGGTFECYFDYIHCDPDSLPDACTDGDPEDVDCDPRDCPDEEDRIFAWVDKRCFEENCDCFVPTKGAYIEECLRCIKDICEPSGEGICN